MRFTGFGDGGSWDLGGRRSQLGSGSKEMEFWCSLGFGVE